MEVLGGTLVVVVVVVAPVTGGTSAAGTAQVPARRGAPGLGTGQLHGGESRSRIRAKTFQGRMDGSLPKRLHGPRGCATAFLAGTRRS